MSSPVQEFRNVNGIPAAQTTANNSEVQQTSKVMRVLGFVLLVVVLVVIKAALRGAMR